MAALVREDTRLALVGVASPSELVASARTFAPDVLLEDRDLDRAPIATPSVALVDDPRAAWLGDRLDRSDRGPHAILSRDAPAGEIVAAIVAVAAGLVAVQPRALAFENDVPVRGEVRDAHDVPTGERLTARERSVLVELARGFPNKTIAMRLGISEHTVKFHIGSIFAKLAVSSRTEAVTQGVRLGLIML
ncbi:MAG: response regulator transcription factor [Candidatus Eremiobacteraeota bacterium]|nr:response regulator transcription factor [Candidatus Eremiobacteraeota bacterium]